LRSCRLINITWPHYYNLEYLTSLNCWIRAHPRQIRQARELPSWALYFFSWESVSSRKKWNSNFSSHVSRSCYSQWFYIPSFTLPNNKQIIIRLVRYLWLEEESKHSPLLSAEMIFLARAIIFYIIFLRLWMLF
jgi:hypothetical protein